MKRRAGAAMRPPPPGAGTRRQTATGRRDGLEGLGDGREHRVELGVVDHERRLQAQHVAEVAADADQHAVLEAVVAHEAGFGRGVGLGLAVGDELDADHEALAAHLADQRLALGVRAEARHELLALGRAPGRAGRSPA